MENDMGMPEEVILSINTHLRNVCTETNMRKNWNINHADEDSLTGVFLNSLATDNEQILPCGWGWKITTNKIRGRGPNAPEKSIGADGIISLNVEENGITKTKSTIFQAKKVKCTDSLKKQKEKMSKCCPNGNMVIIFSPTVCNVQTEDGEVSFTDYMSEFVVCKTGIIGLKYDETKECIVNDIKEVNCDVSQQLNIDVKAPDINNSTDNNS
jgi:hypothetical protein